MPDKIKTIFMGTPDFAAPFLEALVKAPEFEVMAVITQPDKPAGRKQTVTFPAVKILAARYGLTVYQPEKIKDWKLPLEFKPGDSPDLIIVAAYGQILPSSILLWPKYGCVNVHASLLPKYRGAAPIQAAIMSGEKETGITLMKMEAGLDTGPVLRQNKVRIQAADTSGSLFSKLIQSGLEIFIPGLLDYAGGKIKPITQNEAKATYAARLSKKDARIDWAKPAEEIGRMVRAYNPWPGAFFQLSIGHRQLTIKILEADTNPVAGNKYMPGELFTRAGQLAIQCSKDALVIKKIQPAGKKALTGEEFLNGYRMIIRPPD